MPPLCGFGGSSDEPQRHRNQEAPAQEAQRTGKPLSRKVVVIGDGACGKSLLNVFVHGHFPERYEPTVFENHVKDMTIENVPVELALWDTAGQEDFDRLRSLSYADSHVICICFSVDQPTSLENVVTKWIEEVHELCPGVKVCLVALKCDLRDDPATKASLARYQEYPVQYEQGLEVAKSIRASRYLECSARFDRGVREAFEEASQYQAARVAIHARRRGETRGSGPGEDGDLDGQRSSSCVVS
ncbi:BZ3500_MvSof-1268-A1-R1_Chr1-3g01832 [Microbotryum saponariae]|uniref:BZ3500_MvSof-1268-A1-R1_Chr1-3g01832 protein n=1 Tax=Microbotryum saponariae TaxID=289078 RepID=A0A2X0KM24_9BASI|nr:BZ3500_MvSof-1268-A1-R1_Chr1-3g01832 [Microbotryum saponariae]SCZ94699.1 BZ3501_MvSof-1269-A2-R1_Chr1-3g01434 [Microbotryum saponariae]